MLTIDIYLDAGWSEQKHPRAKGGKHAGEFAKGGSGGREAVKAAPAAKAPHIAKNEPLSKLATAKGDAFSKQQFEGFMKKLSPNDLAFMNHEFEGAAKAWDLGLFSFKGKGAQHYHNLRRGLELMKQHGLIQTPAVPLTMYRGLTLKTKHDVGHEVTTSTGAPIQSWSADPDIARKYGSGAGHEFTSAGAKHGYLLQRTVDPKHYLGTVRHISSAYKHLGYGTHLENSHVNEHLVMAPPHNHGKIVEHRSLEGRKKPWWA